MTNIDYIRQMNSEELAEAINGGMLEPCHCCNRDKSIRCPLGIDCTGYIIEWLNMEVEE